MLQTTALANQNEGSLFNGDFARGYASHNEGALPYGNFVLATRQWYF